MDKKYRIIMIAIIIIILVDCGMFSLSQVKKIKEENSKREYSIIASSVYESVQNELSKPISISLAVANDTLLKDLLLKENDYSEEELANIVSKYLKEQKKSMNAQIAFLVSDASKKYISDKGINKTLDTETDGHDVWYSKFVNTRKPYDLDVDTDEVNQNMWTIFINARIEDDNGRLIGVCGFGITMENLQEIIRTYEDKYSIKVNFVNSEGLVQVDTDAINIENKYLDDVQYGKEKDGYYYINSEGEYVTMRYIDSLNWYVIIHGEAYGINFNEIRKIFIGVSIAILVYAVCFWVLRKKSRKNVVQ